ncbi:MAG: alpha/beta hydrolase [Aureispira sp.]|nr:alpha/beta hydrolase [Aureispira sp.]
MNKSINYIHNEPVSFESKVIQFFMGFLGLKNRTVRNLQKGKFLQKAAMPSKSIQKNLEVDTRKENGRCIWTIRPKQNVSEKVILYMHGGAYIYNILKFHWDLLEELVHKTNATIVVPDYPLAPSASCLDVFNYVGKIYTDLLKKVSPQNIILMGDSAGGGIALGFAQELSLQHKPQPSQIILLAPWLDVTMSNPEIVEVNKKDKMLGIKGLQMAGQAYAKELALTDFRVSPIYGNFEGLGQISIFIGTHDSLIGDARKLKGVLDKQDIPMNYFEYPKMFHVWMVVTRMKEARHVIDQIALLVKNEE